MSRKYKALVILIYAALLLAVWFVWGAIKGGQQ